MLNSRSTTMLPSLPLSRASQMIASDLPISGAMPKSPLKLFSVGPATFFLPTSCLSTRAITPLPPRVGPTISMILCRSVRPLMT